MREKKKERIAQERVKQLKEAKRKLEEDIEKSEREVDEIKNIHSSEYDPTPLNKKTQRILDEDEEEEEDEEHKEEEEHEEEDDEDEFEDDEDLDELVKTNNIIEGDTSGKRSYNKTVKCIKNIVSNTFNLKKINSLKKMPNTEIENLPKDKLKNLCQKFLLPMGGNKKEMTERIRKLIDDIKPSDLEGGYSDLELKKREKMESWKP